MLHANLVNLQVLWIVFFKNAAHQNVIYTDYYSFRMAWSHVTIAKIQFFLFKLKNPLITCQAALVCKIIFP